MLACFEGLDKWLPRYLREELKELIEAKLVTVDQVVLDDAEIHDPWISEHIDLRWGINSPLRRAAHAAMAYLMTSRVDLHAVHLHGQDVHDSVTPHFVGFRLRYLTSAMRCFSEHGGVQWLEVVHPTRRGQLLALLIRPANRDKIGQRKWNPGGFFK